MLSVHVPATLLQTAACNSWIPPPSSYSCPLLFFFYPSKGRGPSFKYLMSVLGLSAIFCKDFPSETTRKLEGGTATPRTPQSCDGRGYLQPRCTSKPLTVCDLQTGLLASGAYDCFPEAHHWDRFNEISFRSSTSISILSQNEGEGDFSKVSYFFLPSPLITALLPHKNELTSHP